MQTLNLVMIVKNEQRNLDRCLVHAKPIVDQMIIIDTGSSDQTVDIARSHGANVYLFPWRNDFSAARNFALSKSEADWNLVLDADEYIISGSRQDITSFMENPAHIGALTCIDSYPDGEGISKSTSLISRLLPRGVQYTGRIHEQVDSPLPRIQIPIILEHDGYLLQNHEKGERNLPLLYEELKKHPSDPYFLFQAAVTLRNMNRYKEAVPYFQKFYQFVPADAGYRPQGIIAYIYNMLSLKELEPILPLILNESSILCNDTDFLFVCGVYFTQLVLSDTPRYIQYLPQIEAFYLTCLEIGEHPENQGTVGTGSYKAAYNLGVWYEVTGAQQKALFYYEQAAAMGYSPAEKRLSQFTSGH